MPTDAEPVRYCARPIDLDWLERIGFSVHGTYCSMCLPPLYEEAAIAEIRLTPEEDNRWNISLVQGVPDDLHRHDDHVVLTSIEPRTRGELLPLLRAINAPLRNVP